MTRALFLRRLRCLAFGHAWEDVRPEYLSVYVEKKICRRCGLHEDISILLTVSRYRVPPQANSQIIKNKGRIPGMDKANSDKSSDFYVFNAAEIPRFVLATDIARLLDATNNHHGNIGKPQAALDDSENWLVDYNKTLAYQAGARL